MQAFKVRHRDALQAFKVGQRGALQAFKVGQRDALQVIQHIHVLGFSLRRGSSRE